MALSAAERTRRRFTPTEVRVLFIGESPPAGGTFFYYANSNLYKATRSAFEAAIPALRDEPDFLNAFTRLGCYVEDLCEQAVNHLDLRDPTRLHARAEGVRPLARRIQGWSPRAIVVVMKAIADDAAAALTAAGLDAVDREELPFPARHYDQYVRRLTSLVRSWHRQPILLPLSPTGGP